MPAKLETRIPEIAAEIPIRAGAAVKSAAENLARRASAAAPESAEDLVFKGGVVPRGYLKENIEARSGSTRASAFGPQSSLVKNWRTRATSDLAIASQGALFSSLEGPRVSGAQPRHTFASPVQMFGIFAPWYWTFPEYGTRYFAAEPFMTPAIEEGIPEFLAEVRLAMATL